MHQDFNEDGQDSHDGHEGHGLDEDTVKRISVIKAAISRIIMHMNSPMDPKAIGLLEMVVDMLEEQIALNKYYDYPDCPGCINDDTEKPNFQMLFFENSNGPSVNDLNDMFDTSWMDNENP